MRHIFLTIVVLFLTSCAGQLYYAKSNLNSVTLGQSKTSLLQKFPGDSRTRTPGMQIRAAQKKDDKLIEVGEVLMTDGVSSTVPHWFLFENGLLVQWGRPEDWQNVKTRYEISYNPSVGVSH